MMLRVLRTERLPILQQLRIEEALLRASTDNWLLLNNGCDHTAIVLGLSGKPEQMVHLHAAYLAGVPLIKRFSGGGTVIVDSNTVFATMIMQAAALPNVQPFPRQIMQFTGEVYEDVFAILRRDASRVPKGKVHGLTPKQSHTFALRENDYVFGHKKVAGNAQSITKNRWLHHTSFLWDFSKAKMDLLQQPERRPEYRGNRTHRTFLCPLVSLGFDRQEFLENIEDALVARGFNAQLTGATLASASDGVKPR